MNGLQMQLSVVGVGRKPNFVFVSYTSKGPQAFSLTQHAWWWWGRAWARQVYITDNVWRSEEARRGSVLS